MKKSLLILLCSLFITTQSKEENASNKSQPWYLNYTKITIGCGTVGTILGIATCAASEVFLSFGKTASEKACKDSCENQYLYKLGICKGDQDAHQFKKDLEDFTPTIQKSYPLIIFGEAATAIVVGCLFVTCNKTLIALKNAIFKKKALEQQPS